MDHRDTHQLSRFDIWAQLAATSIREVYGRPCHVITTFKAETESPFVSTQPTCRLRAREIGTSNWFLDVEGTDAQATLIEARRRIEWLVSQRPAETAAAE